jgi:hypothetical protein
VTLNHDPYIAREYVDILYAARTVGSGSELREAVALHVLDHVVKSRNRMLANNQLLKKDPESEARDQGYTRCKVLVLLPCRSSANRFVKTLLGLYPSASAAEGGRVDGMERFREVSLLVPFRASLMLK